MKSMRDWYAMIPEPERHLLFIKCPRAGCGTRIWNQLFTQEVNYQYHYLGHIADDLRVER